MSVKENINPQRDWTSKADFLSMKFEDKLPVEAVKKGCLEFRVVLYKGSS